CRAGVFLRPGHLESCVCDPRVGSGDPGDCDGADHGDHVRRDDDSRDACGAVESRQRAAVAIAPVLLTFWRRQSTFLQTLGRTAWRSPRATNKSCKARSTCSSSKRCRSRRCTGGADTPHRAAFARCTAGRPRFDVPGAGQAGAALLYLHGMAHHREQPARQVLSAHRCRMTSARPGAGVLESIRKRRRPRPRRGELNRCCPTFAPYSLACGSCSAAALRSPPNRATNFPFISIWKPRRTSAAACTTSRLGALPCSASAVDSVFARTPVTRAV